jgi:hypothetical protein
MTAGTFLHLKSEHTLIETLRRKAGDLERNLIDRENELRV